MRSPVLPLVAIAFAGAFLTALPAQKAWAFCRSTTCDTPETFTECTTIPSGCQPLSWRRTCIGWNLQVNASKKIPYEIAEIALDRAFATWQGTFCGPGLEIQNLGPANCSLVEYNGLAGNANIIVFRDDNWPHEGADHNIGLTTVTFDVNTGEIFDADIELNTFQFDLTWDDNVVNYDLVSVITHEAGHFLGLSHSADLSATMYRHYDVGTTGFRDLADDDDQGICDIYPPFEVVPPPCNPIPRHGFSADCASAQKEGSCSAAGAEAVEPASPKGHFAAALAIFSLAALQFGRRRQKNRSI